MLNRKLVYSFFFTGSTLLGSSMMSFATPKKAVDSLPRNDSSHFRFAFDKREFVLTDFPAGYCWELPELPANKTRDAYVTQYISRYGNTLTIIRGRSESFFTLMDTVFARYDVPRELKYLAVVESELNTKALSKAGARGTWQLMPETARILKLRVNGHVDERTHLYKSTVAAAKYLRDLYRLFDDWLLTVAAYNCGPGPVYKAIRTSGSRNFWKLQHLLPAETRGHVKKFIGTHYFFEGKGSVVTLTKAERTHYGNQLQEFVAKHNLLLKDINKTPVPLNGDESEDKPEYVVRSNAELHLGHEQQQGLKSIVDE
ncbi:MAG: lytic transglycosylase domain-containing protein [Chitinophagaceae bacterium]|nr:lytic transglycosylase domain-containing protein [Chitinophagaceae bacterium]